MTRGTSADSSFPVDIFTNVDGSIVNVGSERGFAILESERDPDTSPGSYTIPGARSWELMNSEGIIADTIGAFEKHGFLVMAGNTASQPFNNIPTPYRSLSATALEGHMSTALQPGQHIIAGGNTHFDLYQITGAPGTKVHLHIPTSRGHGDGTTQIAVYWYNSGGLFQQGSGTAPYEEEPTFGEDGLFYLMVSGEGTPGPYAYTMTIANVDPNPFVFPTFKLPEGFLYLISSDFNFRTKAASSASGLMVVEIDADLEHSEDSVKMVGGDSWTITNDKLEEMTPENEVPITPLIEESTFQVRCVGSTMLYVPAGQAEGHAVGGTKVDILDNTPGNATEYAWQKQTVVIQQIGA